MQEQFISLIGWLGAILFVLAYLLLTTRVLTSDGYIYNLMNAFGAVALIVNAIYIHDTPNFAVNAIWMAIALFAVAKSRKSKQGRRLKVD